MPAPVGAAVLATLLVLVGLGDMPYDYYMLLRLALCGISGYLLFGAELPLVGWQKWALAATALLYNPVIPVHLREKDLWIVVNIATVGLFWLVALAEGKTSVSPRLGQRQRHNSSIASSPVRAVGRDSPPRLRGDCGSAARIARANFKSEAPEQR